jgi:hypothetical protein
VRPRADHHKREARSTAHRRGAGTCPTPLSPVMSADSAMASGRCASAMSKLPSRRRSFHRGARRMARRSSDAAPGLDPQSGSACQVFFRHRAGLTLGNAPVRPELTQRRKENLSRQTNETADFPVLHPFETGPAKGIVKPGVRISGQRCCGGFAWAGRIRLSARCASVHFHIGEANWTTC